MLLISLGLNYLFAPLTDLCVHVCVLMGTEEGHRAFNIVGGRSCYQCVNSSETPGQSIVPSLCSRRLSGRSMQRLSPASTHTTHDLHLLPLAHLALYVLLYTVELL